jgi:hypothetical protein
MLLVDIHHEISIPPHEPESFVALKSFCLTPSSAYERVAVSWAFITVPGRVEPKVSLSENFLNQQFWMYDRLKDVRKLLCYYSWVLAAIPDELPYFHPVGCKLNSVTSHWKDREPGRAPRIENDSGVCHIYNIHWIFPLILLGLPVVPSMVLYETKTLTVRCC